MLIMTLVTGVTLIIDQWFDQWYEDMMEAQENFKQWDTQLKDFIEKLVACNESNPLNLPTELEPSKLQSQVDQVQVIYYH